MCICGSAKSHRKLAEHLLQFCGIEFKFAVPSSAFGLALLFTIRCNNTRYGAGTFNSQYITIRITVFLCYDVLNAKVKRVYSLMHS